MTRAIRLTTRRRLPVGFVSLQGIEVVPILGTALIEIPVTGAEPVGIQVVPQMGQAAIDNGVVSVEATGIEVVPQMGQAAIDSGIVSVEATGIEVVPQVGSASVSVPSAGAPSVVDTTTGDSGGNATEIDVVLPTHSAGDLLFAVIVQDADGATFSASGWTVLYNVSIPAGSATGVLAYKVAGGSEPSPVTFTSDTSERIAYAAFAVTDQAGIDVSAATPVTGNSDAPSFPSVTTTVDDCLALAIIWTDGVTTPHTSPSGYTNEVEYGFSSGGSVSVHSREIATAGSETPGAASISSEQWATVTLAVAGS